MFEVLPVVPGADVPRQGWMDQAWDLWPTRTSPRPSKTCLRNATIIACAGCISIVERGSPGVQLIVLISHRRGPA